ncbi:MAG: DnaA/Hda family protein [Pseudomonadota bacterium]
MAKQLAFDLPSKTALGREDFFVSPANATAVATLETPALWPNGKLVLTGPTGAGKTHLAHVWAGDTGARMITAAELETLDIDATATGPLVVEDADQIAPDPDAQIALFHLHNRMAERGQPLLLTASAPPSQWGLTLPDLASRMEATNTVAIELPDDALLSAVLLKLFDDRQLKPALTVVQYLAANMDRSFAQAGAIVTAMDEEALQSGREINRGLAIDILDKIATSGA